MILLPLLLCLVVPVWMWYLGRTYRNGGVPYGKKKGIRFYSKRASASEQVWIFANNLYFNMLRMCGINMGLIAVVLFVAAILKMEHLLWPLCAVLIPVQLIGGFLLPWIFTEWMIRRLFDSKGILISEDSENAEEE